MDYEDMDYKLRKYHIHVATQSAQSMWTCVEQEEIESDGSVSQEPMRCNIR